MAVSEIRTRDLEVTTYESRHSNGLTSLNKVYITSHSPADLLYFIQTVYGGGERLLSDCLQLTELIEAACGYSLHV